MGDQPLRDADVSSESRPAEELSALPPHRVVSGSQTLVQTSKTTLLKREPSKQGWLNTRALPAAAPGETKGPLDRKHYLASYTAQGQKPFHLTPVSENRSVK